MRLGRPIARLSALSLALCAATTVGAETPQIELLPTSDWQVVQREDSCTLSRDFGKTTLLLRSRDPWNGGFHIGLKSKEFIWSGQEIKAGWTPNGRFVSEPRPYLEKSSTDEPILYFRHGLWDGKSPKKGDAEYEAYWSRNDAGEIVEPRKFKNAVEGLLVTGLGQHPVFFRTGAMSDVIEMRNRCIKEMLSAMGLDPSEEDRDDHRIRMTNHRDILSRIARRTPASMVYPENWAGVSFLLYVDDDAEITSCRLLTLPYDASFEKFACKLMQHRAKMQFDRGEDPAPTFYKLHYPVTIPGR